MIDPVTAIDSGPRYRTRLHMLWAAFFDALGVPRSYRALPPPAPLHAPLPTFWLPHSVEGLAEEGWGLWARIEPAAPADLSGLIAFSTATRHNLLLFQGRPLPGKYTVSKISILHTCTPIINHGLTFRNKEGLVSLFSRTFSSYPAIPFADLDAAYDAVRRAITLT